MRATNSLARWGLAACLVGSVGLLQAQDTGFSSDFKLRLGYAPSAKDNLRAYYQGFGWNLNYGLNAGKIGLELGYLYNTGDPYVTMPDASRLKKDNPATTTVNEAQQPVDWANAVDDKRNELSGFAVRLSWTQKLSEEWDWQAGVQIGTQFKHQYVSTVHSRTDATGPDPTDSTKSVVLSTWNDSYNGVPRKGNFISPYVGVSWHLDADSSLEFNAMFLRYDAIEYHHYAGTGVYELNDDGKYWNNSSPWKYDKLDSKSRTVPHLEIAYVFHF